MLTTVEFRDYLPEDRDVLPALFVDALRVSFPGVETGGWMTDLEDIPYHYLETSGDFQVGAIGEQRVAMAGLVRIGEAVGEMKRVAVFPELQGQGIGRRLVTLMEERARGLGIQRLKVNIPAEQKPGRIMYEKLGYKLADIRRVPHPSGNDLDTIYYAKDL